MSKPDVDAVDGTIEAGLLRHKSIRWRVASHIIAGVALTFLACMHLEFAAAMLIVLILTQANLLGGWASLSSENSTWRLLGLILGGSGLTLEIGLASGFELEASVVPFSLAFGAGIGGLAFRFYFGPLK